MGCVSSTPRTSSPIRTTQATAETSAIAEYRAVAGGARNLCENAHRYFQSHQHNDSIVIAMQAIQYRCTALQQEIDNGLANSTLLEHPTSYRQTLESIRNDYMAAVTSRH